MGESIASRDLLSRIGAIESPYDPRGYLFVLAALEYCQQGRPIRGHISGDELSKGCRDFAIEQYGLMSRIVLAHWGIQRTEDFGEIVYGLIDAGLLVGNDGDRKEDFARVFDFAEEFETQYPWLSNYASSAGELNPWQSST